MILNLKEMKLANKYWQMLIVNRVTKSLITNI